MVVRHHVDRGRGQALSDIGAVEVDLHGGAGHALPDDLEPEPAVRAVVRTAAGPGRDRDGLV